MTFKEFLNEKTSEYVQKLRDDSVKTAGRKNDKWTDDDWKAVVIGRLNKKTYKEIAYELGRSHSGIDGSIQRLKKSNKLFLVLLDLVSNNVITKEQMNSFMKIS